MSEFQLLKFPPSPRPSPGAARLASKIGELSYERFEFLEDVVDELRRRDSEVDTAAEALRREVRDTMESAPIAERRAFVVNVVNDLLGDSAERRGGDHDRRSR